MTAPSRWQPSQSARNAAAAATTGIYDEPPPWDGGAHCTGRLGVGTRALGGYILAAFPGVIASFGGYNCRPNTADTANTSLHGTGRALDLTVSVDGDHSRAADVVADWLLTNARALGVEEVIWTRTIWTSLHGLRDYTGPDAHTSHIHVGLSPESARSLPPIPTGDGASGASTSGVLGGIAAGGLLVAALAAWSSRRR